MPCPLKELLETKKTNRFLHLALFGFTGAVQSPVFICSRAFLVGGRGGIGKPSPSHRTAVCEETHYVSGHGEALTVSTDICLNLGEKAWCF